MAVVDMQTDQTTEIERLRADCDAWRDASMRAHIIIQRFALEREHLVDAQDALRQKLEELITEAHSGGASETVVSGLAELLGLVREIAVRNCPIDELARRRDGAIDTSRLAS